MEPASSLTAMLTVAAFLWLFAWLPVLIHPTFRKSNGSTVGYLAAMAGVTVGIGSAGAFIAPALGGFLILVYAGAIVAWTASAVKARRSNHQLKARATRQAL